VKNIGRILDQVIIHDLSSETKEDVLSEMCSLVKQNTHVTDSRALLHAIKARETIMSTGIGMGIAIPHAKIASVTDIVMVVGTSGAGIDYEALDDMPVHKIILIAASNTQGDEFLSVLGKIGAFLNEPDKREQFLQEQAPDKIKELLQSIGDQK